MGIWWFAGAFAVVKRQSECGSKTSKLHVSQPVPISVLWARRLCNNLIRNVLVVQNFDRHNIFLSFLVVNI